MTQEQAIKIVEAAVIALGHTRINPESLTELKESADANGWLSAVPHHDCYGLNAAYNIVMAGFRALFAPVR